MTTSAAIPLATPPEADLDRLWHDHHRRVLQAAYRVTGSAADAEDVLQTVFLRLARREEIPPLGTLAGAYLQRAAVNAAFDLVRRRKREGLTPLEPLEPLLAQGIEAAPDRERRERDVEAWLRAALAQVSPQAGEVFALHFFEGLANHEIADLLGLTRNAVAVLLHRTRRQLREAMGPVPGGSR